MKYPFEVTITHRDRAWQLNKRVQLGHYFVFVRHKKNNAMRLKRLLVDNENQNEVLPLVTEPIELEGITITPHGRLQEPIGCVVTDRHLYQAEQDNVHLFIALPHPPPDLRLSIACDGEFLTERQLELNQGLGIETLSLLPAGHYEAQLLAENRPLGFPMTFTVAEYTLAPLSARLVHYNLKPAVKQLWFELAVDSYQMPFEDELIITLIDQGREISQVGLLPLAPGRYAGGIKIYEGEGSFYLRLVAAADPERITEVVVPPMQIATPPLAVVSELGAERLFSLAATVQALPIRGGYLTEEVFLSAPVTVPTLLTERTQRLLEIHAHIESLVLINFDLCAGHYQVQKLGTVQSGTTVNALAVGSINMVFVGGFVYGQPFEGYTTFIEPSQLQLSVEAPTTLGTETEFSVRIQDNNPQPRSLAVLLCIREQRLKGFNLPALSLGALMRQHIETATADMNNYAFVSMMDLEPVRNFEAFDQHLTEELELYISYERFDQAQALLATALEKYPHHQPYQLKLKELSSTTHHQELPKDLTDLSRLKTAAERAALRGDLSLEEDLSLDLASNANDEDNLSLNQSEEEELSLEEDLSLEEALSLDNFDNDSEETLTDERVEDKLEPTAPEFFKILFYELIELQGSQEITIPTHGWVGQFSIETFTLSGGDWAHTQQDLVIEQPVRIELGLPTAVHDTDQIFGELQATSRTHKAQITLMRDGQYIPLHYQNNLNERIDTSVIDTPVALSFNVQPGAYTAAIEDQGTGEQDSVEVRIHEPGQFQYWTQELVLLQAGDTLMATEDQHVQILEDLHRPWERLLKAVMAEPFSSCETTAAKIFAASWLYITTPHQRHQAEQFILGAVPRLGKLLLPHQGLTHYYRDNSVDKHTNQRCVRYLWQLHLLSERADLSRNLRQAVSEGLALADQVATRHQFRARPQPIQTIEDAYAWINVGSETKAARQFIEHIIERSETQVKLKKPQDAVTDRMTLAYTAASLLAMGYAKWGFKIANQVLHHFNAQGRLYSTRDSSAAIHLLAQIRRLNLITPQARLRLDQHALTLAEAQHQRAFNTLEVVDGIVAVAVQRLHSENWQAYETRFAVDVAFQTPNGKPMSRFKLGERTELVVSLPEGYQVGDIVEVILPACLTWVQGGNHKKHFSLDFAGRYKLTIPLVVTSTIQGKQHFALCVRNLFKQERITSPGVLWVEG